MLIHSLFAFEAEAQKEVDVAGQRTRAPGALETAVMRVLWSEGRPMTSLEIQELVGGKRPAQTTLLTSLDRLSRKGMVHRVGDAVRRVQFEATMTEAEYASQIMMEALPDAASRGAALLKFAGDLATEDLDILRQAIFARAAPGRAKKHR